MCCCDWLVDPAGDELPARDRRCRDRRGYFGDGDEPRRTGSIPELGDSGSRAGVAWQSHHPLLLQFMTETGTGPRRIKGLLPAGTVVAHKTGTSGTRGGLTRATNDIGLVTLAGGRHLYEELAQNGLARRGQVRRVPLSFGAAARGLCACDRRVRVGFDGGRRYAGGGDCADRTRGLGLLGRLLIGRALNASSGTTAIVSERLRLNTGLAEGLVFRELDFLDVCW